MQCTNKQKIITHIKESKIVRAHGESVYTIVFESVYSFRTVLYTGLIFSDPFEGGGVIREGGLFERWGAYLFFGKFI